MRLSPSYVGYHAKGVGLLGFLLGTHAEIVQSKGLTKHGLA